MVCRLEQQCRFADPRVAADQDERTGDEPAAENAIKLGYTAGYTLFRVIGNLIDPQRGGFRKGRCRAGPVFSAISSVMVFQELQSGHFPSHFADW